MCNTLYYSRNVFTFKKSYFGNFQTYRNVVGIVSLPLDSPVLNIFYICFISSINYFYWPIWVSCRIMTLYAPKCQYFLGDKAHFLIVFHDADIFEECLPLSLVECPSIWVCLIVSWELDPGRSNTYKCSFRVSH